MYDDSGVISLSPAIAKSFHFVIFGFRSFQPVLAFANEINHDIHVPPFQIKIR